MATKRATHTHFLEGRESTACGRGDKRPAFTTRAPERVSCPRCLAALRRQRCPDCGVMGERKGHMTCQYPQD